MRTIVERKFRSYFSTLCLSTSEVWKMSKEKITSFKFQVFHKYRQTVFPFLLSLKPLSAVFEIFFYELSFCGSLLDCIHIIMNLIHILNILAIKTPDIINEHMPCMTQIMKLHENVLNCTIWKQILVKLISYFLHWKLKTKVERKTCFCPFDLTAGAGFELRQLQIKTQLKEYVFCFH